MDSGLKRIRQIVAGSRQRHRWKLYGILSGRKDRHATSTLRRIAGLRRYTAGIRQRSLRTAENPPALRSYLNDWRGQNHQDQNHVYRLHKTSRARLLARAALFEPNLSN